MTAVKGKRGRHSHMTRDVRGTACGLNCDGWIVLGFDPREEPEQVSCRTCRAVIEMEFN